jgi:hexosaminidase
MWGEQVDDTDIDTRIWPRACATAERLWSDATLRDVDAAEERIEHQRCRMARRGVRAGPIRPSSEYGYCHLPESMY